jgi:hypothetical protein
MMHLQLGFTPTKLRAKTRYFECSITLVEQHVEWIGDCIDYMRKARKTRIEATIEAQEQWVDHVNEIVNMTLYPNTNSWYMSANIRGSRAPFCHISTLRESVATAGSAPRSPPTDTKGSH